MRNRELLRVREGLMKSKKAYFPKDELLKDEDTQVKDIVEELGLPFTVHHLTRKTNADNNSKNNFMVDDRNMIYFYPPIDGIKSDAHWFYKKDEVVINTNCAYLPIINLDELILQMIRIYSKCLDKKIVLDPFYFILKLKGEVKRNFNGPASLVLTEKAIRNQKLNAENFEVASKHFVNKFIDAFIGWNFGLLNIVKENKQLQLELNNLKQKAIDMGLRESTDSSFCLDDDLQYGDGIKLKMF